MEWFTLVATSAVVSAIVSGLLTLLNAHLQRKAEERKRLADLAMKLAMTEWEKHLEMARVGHGANVQPPEIYLYRYSKLIPLIEKGELSVENLESLNLAIKAIVKTKG